MISGAPLKRNKYLECRSMRSSRAFAFAVGASTRPSRAKNSAFASSMRVRQSVHTQFSKVRLAYSRDDNRTGPRRLHDVSCSRRARSSDWRAFRGELKSADISPAERDLGKRLSSCHTLPTSLHSAAMRTATVTCWSSSRRHCKSAYFTALLAAAATSSRS